MTERQILLVKNSWSYAIVNAEEAGQLFYERLFEVAPEVKYMFKTDSREQAKKLVNMVTLIVTKLQKLDEIIGDIRKLAERHNKYGVHPAHYAAVGESLIWTLAKGLGERWNKETEDAWIKVYGILSSVMINRQAETSAAL